MDQLRIMAVVVKAGRPGRVPADLGGRAAQEPLGDVYVVNRRVGQRALGSARRVAPDVAMRPQGEQRNTESAGVELAFHRREPRMAAPHEANRDQFPHAAAPLCGHDLLAVLERGREWLSHSTGLPALM